MIPNWSRTGSCSIIAHRGGAALGRENSLDVLGAALNAGADAVEIDLRELGDGSLVLVHDRSIGKRWRRAEIRNLDRAEYIARTGRTPELFDGLIERLAALPLGLYIDVKQVTANGLGRIIEALTSSSLAGRTIVGSSDHGIVRAVADDGRLTASVLYSDRSTDAVSLAGRLGCTIVHPCYDNHPSMVARLSGEWVRRVHDADLAIIGWNSNSPELLAGMAAAGFDALCTDDPRLVQHATWRAGSVQET